MLIFRKHPHEGGVCAPAGRQSPGCRTAEPSNPSPWSLTLHDLLALSCQPGARPSISIKARGVSKRRANRRSSRPSATSTARTAVRGRHTHIGLSSPPTRAAFTRLRGDVRTSDEPSARVSRGRSVFLVRGPLVSAATRSYLETGWRAERRGRPVRACRARPL